MAVAPLVIAGVSIAASAAGTAATISAQRKQAAAQEEAALSSALDAQERADLAIERNEIVKQSAKLLRDRELAALGAQRTSARLAIEQNTMANRLAQIQSGLQSSTIRAQGDSQALGAEGEATQVKMAAEQDAFSRDSEGRANLLQSGNEVTNANNQLGQVGLGNASATSQASAAFGEVGQAMGVMAGQGTSDAELAAAQAGIGNVQDVVGQTSVNNQQTRGAAQFNANLARTNYQLAAQQLALAQQYGQQNTGLAGQYANLITQMGNSQRYMSGLGASSVDVNQLYQDQIVAQSNQAQGRINNIQSKRNENAIRGGYQSALATGNTQTLSSVLQEKSNIAAALAQANQARAQAPSGLATLSAIAGGVSAAYQSGIFQGIGGRGTAAQPSTSQITQGPSASQWGIAQAQSQLRGNSPNTITGYPPINYGEPLR